jgi:ribosomal peptide maturation radical SAM protein 1
MHLNLFLLKHLRVTTYNVLSSTFALNDFLFTHPLDSLLDELQLDRLRAIVHSMNTRNMLKCAGYSSENDFVDLLLTLRNDVVPRYLNECVVKVLAERPTLVGFSCMFDQTIASVALAKLLKEHQPNLFVVLGGYGMQGPAALQIMQSFPWIDCVSHGEGEDVIVPLARASVDRDLLPSIPGLLYRPGLTSNSDSDKPGIAPTPQKQKPNIDESPTPNYDDFFADLATLADQNRVRVIFDTLPIETSRGCWWGQVHHCVFCGIDKETMKYRAKKPERTLEILRDLRERYSISSFRISDYILPSTYFKTLLPRLAALPDSAKYRLTCEIKANMSYEKFELMKNAGFTEVQPGVESFSSSVLKKMDKGVSAIQNIYTLLLGARFGIKVHFNFLFGFPTDRIEDYHAMATTLPLIYHLEPPNDEMCPVQITRFAPLQTNPERFGIKAPSRHHSDYDVVFSTNFLANRRFDLSNYCYYFEHTYTHSADLEELYSLLAVQVRYWRKAHEEWRAALEWEATSDGIAFSDSRYGPTVRRLCFGQKHAKVYRDLGDGIQTLSALQECADNSDEEGYFDALKDLESERLVFREGPHLLGLAVPRLATGVNRQKAPGKWAVPYV